MTDSSYADSTGDHDPFSSSHSDSVSRDLSILLDRARTLAREKHQGLNTTHLLAAALDPAAGPLPAPLGTVIADHVRRSWYGLAWNHLAQGRMSPPIESCLPLARRVADGRPMSAALFIVAIVENDPDAHIWLTSVCGVQGNDNELLAQLHSAAEESLGSKRLVIQMGPGQLRVETQRMLTEQKLTPTPPSTFAHAHTQVLRNLATELAVRHTRGIRIPVVQGPKGSGVERFAQALAEAPKAKSPFTWPFEDTYTLNIARLLGRDNAHAILKMALEIIGTNSLLVLTESRAFDRFTEDAQRAKDCLDFLRSETPANVLLVYRTDDTWSLPEGTRLHREIFQDFKIEQRDEQETRQLVSEAFTPYWDEVERVTVAEDALEDVYPISAYISEDEVHFNLPYLPIVMATNAAQTVKCGREAILDLAKEAQTRLTAARNATKSPKSLEKAFAAYFDTLQLELNALREHADAGPRTRNGLPLVTRELVTAELAASSVYLFHWPKIQAVGAVTAITPTDYPTP